MSSTPPETDGAADAGARPDEPRSLRIEDWLTVIIMAALALITFANVLVRYFTNSSFAWTEEISVFLMILLALVAGSAAVARNQHIRIEFSRTAARPAPQGSGPVRLSDGGAAVCHHRRAQRARGLGRLPLRGDLARHRRAPVVVFDLAARGLGPDHRARHRPVHPPGQARRLPDEPVEKDHSKEIA
jgi:uncharacterized integral membrane protein